MENSATFENGTKTLKLTHVSGTVSDCTPSHYFELIWDDGDIDKLSIRMGNNPNIAKWLQDNCDIEGTQENVNTLLNLIS